jgi:PAS domain S-box-containing protein
MTDAFPKRLLPPTPLPENEAGRLEALRRYRILDTPPEAGFDRVTSLAARLFDVPIALVSLVDESRAWFKSCYGFELQEVQRDDTICSFALLFNEVLVVLDARQDDRFACNPFVQAEPGLRFYAGAPLLTKDGFNLGTLCLLDTKPRNGFPEEQQAILSDFAAMVMDELELRLAAHKVAEIDAALLEVTQGVAATTGDGFFSALVQHFTKTLGADYTYIGLVSGDNQDAIRTIAACAKGEIIDNFEYLLRDTPCQEVIQNRKLCCYPSGVQAQFPQAPLLKPLSVESYAAIPFFDPVGTPLGLLGVMDSKPLANVQLAETLLPIFAMRIATELERQQTEAARQQTQQELEHLVEQRTAELSNINQRLQLEIAERQQAEAALQKEQEMLRVLLDNVQAGIVACNAEGILTLFNRVAREFHGLPEQPLPPDRWAEYYDLYMPNGRTRMPQTEIPLFRALQGETVYNVEMVIAPKQGTPRTLLASGQAIVDAQGQSQGAVVVMHDITERKQAEAELLISDAALQQMPDAILLTDLEGKIERWLGNAEQIFGYTAAEVIGKPVNFLHHPDIQPTMTAEMIRSIQETGAFCGEVPCRRKDGSAVPIETTSKTVYDKVGNPLFLIGINKDITDRKQVEAERVQLIQEQAARLEAEAEQQRLSFLAEVSTALASSLDYEQTFQRVAQLAVPYFADWCSVDLLNDDGTISRVAVAHSEPEKVQLGWELAQRFPRHLDDGYGISEVMKTGQSQIAIEITDEQLVASVTNPEYLEILRGVGLKSCIVAPLQARERVLGSISFVFAESDRHYNSADLALAEDLAGRAAIAIDNAHLYYTAQQAKQAAETAANRTARLQTVTAALSESLTPEQVAEVIVEQSMAALDADAALTALLSQDGTTLEIVQAVGYEINPREIQQQISINASVPLAEAVRSGQPAWLEPLANRLVRYPHLADAYKRHPFQAWISLPLMVEGKAVGGLSLSFKQFKQLSQDDREFMLTLSRQCAQAISRAQSYEAERNARAEAEKANRIKDEFLAVLSHELRSPLNPILGWSKLLQQPHNPATLTRGLQTIERNAKLQTQLIEDLLDVSRILQGKLNLNVVPVNLKLTIEAAMETVRLAAKAKAIEIQTQLDSDVGYIAGDAGRLQQVVWNLLSNAVKFTPDRGQVQITLEQVNSQAQIQVSDTGKGITPEFLPYIFDRFRQADSKTTRQFGGLGLGLAIVRQLVELHGGTVHVKSEGEGHGATFTVNLPLLGNREWDTETRKTTSDSSLSTPHFPLNGLQILVVDDETDARELLVFILEQAGAIVTSVASAIEALQALTHSKIDVLISDIGMPDMDGYMLIQQVQAQFAKGKFNQSMPKAIALTAYAGEMNQQKALAAGFQRHLSKPVEPTELVAAIASLIQ